MLSSRMNDITLLCSTQIRLENYNFVGSRVMKVLLVPFTYLSKSASSQELEDFILSSHGVEDLVLYELIVAVGGLGLCGGGPPSLAVCRRLAVCDPSLWLIPFARLALKQYLSLSLTQQPSSCSITQGIYARYF